MAQVRNIDASDSTGKDLLKFFEAKVDGDEWEAGNHFIFIGGRYQIKIEAYPASTQKGNGRLSVGGHAHTWETLEPTLSGSKFNKKYKTFLENELNSPHVKDFKEMEFECCALLLFEIARRVDKERKIDVNFLTRDEVDEAIDKALNCELGSSLTGIFCGKDITGRRSRYDVIMSKMRTRAEPSPNPNPNVTDVKCQKRSSTLTNTGDDIASLMGNLDLKDKKVIKSPKNLVIKGPGNLLARKTYHQTIQKVN